MITRVPGIRVGHATDAENATGCTVILPPAGTIGSGAVNGGAPATRETDVLRPGMLVNEVHAVLLTGGSAFGLAAADGVMRFLRERNVGFETGVARVPIVPTAAIFDLWVGAASHPSADDGEVACRAARDGDVEEGSVGAGTGATVAKENGPQHAVKGGVGSASVEGEGIIVGALIVNNAVGEVLDADGNLLAGALEEPNERFGGAPQGPLPGTNTVIGVVATNAKLSKERAQLLAIAAHEGTSAAVRPAHTMWDGDTIFSLATGEVDAPQPTVEELAVNAVAEAVRRSVRLATPLAGVPTAHRAGEAGLR
ncbi:MAG TPA: P1 family peptidase [Actinomycetota bacterium]